MSLDLVDKVGTMPDRTTVISCPEHDLCVCTFRSCSPEELKDRGELSLPYAYHEWQQVLGEAIFAVEHTEAQKGPNALLVGEVIIAPKDIAPRMATAEARIARVGDDVAIVVERIDDEAQARLEAVASLDDELGKVSALANLAHYHAETLADLHGKRIRLLEDYIGSTRKGRRWLSCQSGLPR